MGLSLNDCFDLGSMKMIPSDCTKTLSEVKGVKAIVVLVVMHQISQVIISIISLEDASRCCVLSRAMFVRASSFRKAIIDISRVHQSITYIKVYLPTVSRSIKATQARPA